LTREQRRRVFSKCIAAEKNVTSSTATPYPTGWFLPNNTMPKRQDVVDWLLWAVFPTPTTCGGGGSLAVQEEYREEIDGYIEEIEKLLGRSLEERTDNNGIRSMRITLDPVTMLHRPLIWYFVCYSN
jgi:hypothetical protein